MPEHIARMRHQIPWRDDVVVSCDVMTRLFLSHAWKRDGTGRNTHARVKEVRDALHALHTKTWFDEDYMIDDMDASMAAGIDSCDAVCVFLTQAYCRKVDSAARNPSIRDNCYKEFSYAQTSGKRCINIVFEPSMLDVAAWPSGIVKLYLGSKLYIDGTRDDFSAIARRIVETLRRQSFDASPQSPLPLPPSDAPPSVVPYVDDTSRAMAPTRVAPVLLSNASLPPRAAAAAAPRLRRHANIGQRACRLLTAIARRLSSGPRVMQHVTTSPTRCMPRGRPTRSTAHPQT